MEKVCPENLSRYRTEGVNVMPLVTLNPSIRACNCVTHAHKMMQYNVRL